MKNQLVIPLLIAITALGGCNFPSVDADLNEAVQVSLINTEGKEVGQATLTENPKGVHILLKAEGLTPGVKAIHFHETAICEKPSLQQQGHHFNPTQKSMGFKIAKGYHLGDLPNIEVGEDGKVELETVSPAVVLTAGKVTHY